VAEGLLPSDHRPALFAVVAFAVAATGFSLQSAIVGSLRRESSASISVGIGRYLVVGLAGAAFTTISLLWLSVITALN
jgi:hypothetical protein